MSAAPYDRELVRALVASIRKTTAERDRCVALLLDHLEAVDAAANDVTRREKDRARLARERLDRAMERNGLLR